MSFYMIAVFSPLFFIAGIVKGSIGFALPIATIPFLSLFISPVHAVALMSISLFSTNVMNVTIGLKEWRNLENIIPFLIIGLCSVPAGVFLLNWLNPNIVRLILAFAIALFVFLRRIFPTPKVNSNLVRKWGLGGVFGFLSGFLGGMIGIPGPSTLIYFSMFSWKKDTFIFLVNVFNALISGLLILSFFSQGIYTKTLFLHAILVLVPVFLGYWIGLKLRRKINQNRFEFFVKIVLIAVAIVLFIRSFSSLNL
ncbi:MAG: sulfite exporter TauE/SafE family protein [Nitrospinota bacterium]|nr:sulfite exporter TauE/SafE family protein [Nitrospinota bacterium]